MGALAGAAAKRWPEIPKLYAELLALTANVPIILGFISKTDKTKFISALKVIDNPFLLLSENHTSDIKNSWCALVAYPTMHLIEEPASLDLVIRSAELLCELADLNEWKEIYLGSPGTGAGGLDVKEVHHALTPIFDDRFTVMQK